MEHAALCHYLFFQCSLTEKNAQASNITSTFTSPMFPVLDNYLIYETTSKLSLSYNYTYEIKLLIQKGNLRNYLKIKYLNQKLESASCKK